MIDRYFKAEFNRLNYIKLYGPEKCPVLLIFSHAGEKSTQIKRNTKKLTDKVYRASKHSVIFTSNSILSPKSKDLISNKDKICVIYTFECCCSNSYTGQTYRHLAARIKEHISKCLRDHTINQLKKISIASPISEHLIKKPIGGKNYNEMNFSIFRSCNNGTRSKSTRIKIHPFKLENRLPIEGKGLGVIVMLKKK